MSDLVREDNRLSCSILRSDSGFRQFQTNNHGCCSTNVTSGLKHITAANDLQGRKAVLQNTNKQASEHTRPVFVVLV